MRKNLVFIFLAFLLFPYTAFSVNVDSLAYEQQRSKINNMLDERSSKFGLYAESLKSRTGIFGLKTKKDMQKSIDILAEIVKTDNAILKETKVLLDYKTFEQEKVVTESKENSEKNLAYMRTINKLQTENERLKNELIILKDSRNNYKLYFYILLITLVAGGLFIYSKFYRKKR